MTVTRARLVLCVAACVLVATDCAPASDSTSRARTTAALFLDRYVQADGR
jgi:hypothetical protein